MRVAVVSCAAYRDTWKPFATLFRNFWSDCEYPLWLVTDEGSDDAYDNVFAMEGDGADSWCRRMVAFADSSPDPILMFLDDFFLTQSVNVDRVCHGLEILNALQAGCIRLYPCPGADQEYGHRQFGLVSYAAPYRISTMPAIWNPAYLSAIASQCDSPWSFETEGTKHSRRRAEPVLAWKREVQPWPLEIMATGIWRGKWTNGAKLLFAQHGIPLKSTREDM